MFWLAKITSASLEGLKCALSRIDPGRGLVVSKLENMWGSAMPDPSEPHGTGIRRCRDGDAGGARSRRNRLLAVLLPDGSAWYDGEAKMWERSQVEQLTGLSRHMVQDLCYQNTKRGGLGFWEPAVSKPGYSRFDEGDLLMFYLVGQLKRAGFTLREVEEAVFDILEEGGMLGETLRVKARALHARRAELDDQLAALECLEDAAEVQPDERLYAVMESATLRNAARAVEEAAREEHATAEEAEPIRAGFEHLVRELLMELGEKELVEAPLAEEFAELRQHVGRLLAVEADPASAEAHVLASRLARHIANAGGAGDVGAVGRRARVTLRALALFLNDAANGVPVELVFGNGSFVFLAQAAGACGEVL